MNEFKAKTTTRSLILRTLLTSSGATVKELAENTQVSPITVRHHLTSLQADNLVEAVAMKRSVGRPHYAYRLTESGLEMFPSRYVALSRRLLQSMATSLSSAEMQQMLDSVAQSILSEHGIKDTNLSIDERMRFLASVLEQEGFMVTWESTDKEIRITEHNCPYRDLVADHPVLCGLDQTLIASALGAPVDRVACTRDDAQHCTYVVKQKLIKINDRPK
ncbi:MAG: ArsR family transcriptional regulator [Chloroflexota bacterium]